MGGFDIDNAFVLASLEEDERVICRLPKHWSNDERGDIVRLYKSLYGLRQAPLRWFQCYRAGLESLGWIMDQRETGLFSWTDPETGHIYRISVYVDDSIVTGRSPAMVQKLMLDILGKFKGRIIEPTHICDKTGRETRDILGADVIFGHKYLKICMKN